MSFIPPNQPPSQGPINDGLVQNSRHAAERTAAQYSRSHPDGPVHAPRRLRSLLARVFGGGKAEDTSAER